MTLDQKLKPLENILIEKNEIPIKYNTCFHVPIHPILIEPEIRLDPVLAPRIFPQVVVEWYDEMTTLAELERDQETKKRYQSTFLKQRPVIDNEKLVNFTVQWKPNVKTTKEGFAKLLSLGGNSGLLYFYPQYSNVSQGCVEDVNPNKIRFTPEKFCEYSLPDLFQGDGVPGRDLYVYQQHNIEDLPTALFFRNWAIMYLNEALKSIEPEQLQKFVKL